MFQKISTLYQNSSDTRNKEFNLRWFGVKNKGCSIENLRKRFLFMGALKN